MWINFAKVAAACLLASPVLAGDPPPISVPQVPDVKPLGAAPSGNPFSEPFFAPPGGAPVMDKWRPGSGAEQGDLLTPPAPAPFRPERVWFAGDFYHSVGQGTLLPPLVTTSANGTGALNEPTTRIVFGGERALNRFRPGLRANAGLWLTDDYRFGIDGTIIYTGDVSSEFRATTNPAGPVLSRPVFLGNFGTQVGVPVGAFAPGSISASAHSAVIGGDVNFRYGWKTSELGRLDVLVGYRYMNLRDNVDVSTRSEFAVNPIGGLTAAIGDFTVSDHFRTLNQFHGGQIGLGGTHRLFGRLTLTTKATVAVGVNITDVSIDGRTTSIFGTTKGGLLTGENNIGNTRENYFSVMPEATAKLGWDFTDRVRLNAGYSFLFWTNVRRAADQIDTTIQFPNRPAFLDDTTTYWLQGWTVGLDLRW